MLLCLLHTHSLTSLCLRDALLSRLNLSCYLRFKLGALFKRASSEARDPAASR